MPTDTQRLAGGCAGQASSAQAIPQAPAQGPGQDLWHAQTCCRFPSCQRSTSAQASPAGQQVRTGVVACSKLNPCKHTWEGPQAPAQGPGQDVWHPQAQAPLRRLQAPQLPTLDQRPSELSRTAGAYGSGGMVQAEHLQAASRKALKRLRKGQARTSGTHRPAAGLRGQCSTSTQARYAVLHL